MNIENTANNTHHTVLGKTSFICCNPIILLMFIPSNTAEFWQAYFSKFEERPLVIPEVAYVKHGLGVGQVWEVYCQSGIHTIPRPEVWDPTRHRHLQNMPMRNVNKT